MSLTREERFEHSLDAFRLWLNSCSIHEILAVMRICTETIDSRIGEISDSETEKEFLELIKKCWGDK